MVRLLYIVVLFFAQSAWSQSQCVNMQLQTGTTVINFNTATAQTPIFTIKANTNPGGCDFFLTFDYGNSGSYSNRAIVNGSNSWPYQLYKSSSKDHILKHIPQANSDNDVVVGTLAPGSNNREVNVSYYVELDSSGGWGQQGNYTGGFTVRLYRGNISGSYSLVTSQYIAINHNAQKRADISITSTGGVFDVNDTTETLNFGVLGTGQTRSASIILKYNAGYQLFVSSQNNGRLKHANANQFINYSFTVNGTLINLNGTATSPYRVLRVLGSSPPSGTVIPVVATVGTVLGTMPAGVYKDTITLTVQSAE